MTREKQIRSAACEASMTEEIIMRQEVIKDGVHVGYKDIKLRNSERPIARLFFMEGVKWADANQPNPWISVEDRLPEIGTTILEAYTIVAELQGHRREQETIVLTKYDGNFIGDGSIEHMMGGTTCSTTHHWMPIPQLPKEE
jgi:hypothetical protein